MSVSATVELRCDVVEVLEGNPDSASPSNRTITHTLFNVAKSLDAASTPPATKLAAFVQALAAGAATIDLTSLLSANGITLDGTGLEVCYVRIANLGDNPLAVKKGASNGHDLFTDDGIEIPAGGSIGFVTNGSTEIDATHCTWDLAGTLVETAQWTILLG